MNGNILIVLLGSLAVLGLGEAVGGSYRRECHCDAETSDESPNLLGADIATKKICKGIGGGTWFRRGK